ncbi:MAG: hypothetical protein LCH30_10075 [Proteobacteria bacterium]|nr:hypothetical protein [Pseudomonadota bacterium]
MFYLLIIFCLSLCFLTLPWLNKTWRLWQWRKALGLRTKQKIFNKLYHLVNGFLLSQKARQRKDSPELVYGEIEFESFVALISITKPNKDTVFYDLGSGTGKAVIAASLVFAMKKSVGIELLEELHLCAHSQKERLLAIAAQEAKTTNIQFKRANFLNENVNEASLIFINATAFFGEHWLVISKKLEELNQDTIVISSSKKLKSNQFKHLYSTHLTMSWGIVEAFIQQRN